MQQDDYDHYVSVFVNFDRSERGVLTRSDALELFKCLNFVRNPQDEDRIFREMDADGGGTVSLGEFLTWLKYHRPNPQALYGLTQTQYNTIMMQFYMYDTDKDGYLNVNDFSSMVLKLGDVRDASTAQRLFHMIDKDRNGVVDLHEFLTFRAGKG